MAPGPPWAGTIRHFEDDGPLLRELDRIADEIDQNLVKAIWIAGQRAGDIGSEMTRQFQAFLIRSHRENFDCFFNEIAQVEFDRLEFDMAGLHLGKVKNVVDQLE